MRCAGALPSIKNVRGRSPRPIWVMTSSIRRHGAIHLRQAMKATQPNAAQIRTRTNQATAFLFSSKYFSQQSGCEDVSQSQTTSLKVSLGTARDGPALECGVSSHRFRTHAVTLRGADSQNRAQFQSRRRLCRVFRAVGERACRPCGCRSRFRSPRRR
jgi:hypothetical protein